MSLVCWRESRTTTSICIEEWCIGVVLAMTSKPICLKSSRVATGQLLQRLTGCYWSLPLFHPCFQYVDNKVRLGGACNICPTSKPLRRASSPPLALSSELLWFIQFFSRESAARLIGIPSNLFSKSQHLGKAKRQIGGQSVRFALYKRFTVSCKPLSCQLLAIPDQNHDQIATFLLDGSIFKVYLKTSDFWHNDGAF